MEIKQQINHLFAKEMDRKDFIKHIAIGAVTLVGGGVVLQLLSQGQPRASHQVDDGFAYGGDSVYGGSPTAGGEHRQRRTA